MKKHYTVILIMIFTSAQLSFAQMNKGNERWFVGGHGGVNAFWGDITDNGNHIFPGGPFQEGYYKDRKGMYGIILGKEINSRFSFRAQYIRGNLRSTSDFDKKKFSSRINETNLSLHINLIDLFGGDSKSPWTIDLFAGMGMLSFRSIASSTITGETIRTAPNDSLSYALKKNMNTLVIPFGLSINYNINENFRLSFETTMHSANSDWLDAEASKKRSFEGYSYSGLSFIYFFNIPTKEMRRSNTRGNFKAETDTEGKNYRNYQRNGKVGTSNHRRKPYRSAVKGKPRKSGKVFKVPKGAY